MPLSEADLAARRSSMTLAERVEARRALDAAAGIVYPDLPVEVADRIVALLVA